MTWDDLLKLLTSYQKDGDADMTDIVRFHGNDVLEPLVLAENAVTGGLMLVVNWDVDKDDTDG